ncbi:hypothetical protein AGMMS49959_05040 [Planctomycetales bacterium]|nr:hypothetical protein AGMMS49959_05040 [Planctomycetales bacterium]
MSAVKIDSIGFKRYRVTVAFSAAETVNADRLRFAGAKIRGQEKLTAEFLFDVTDRASAAAMTKLLVFFGEGGDFAAGGKIYFDNDEPEWAMVAAQTRIAATIDEWQECLTRLVAWCLQEKMHRAATLRLVRAALGDIPEDAVRRAVEEYLRDRYDSLIFCRTVMRRRGWDEAPAVAAVNPAAVNVA